MPRSPVLPAGRQGQAYLALLNSGLNDERTLDRCMGIWEEWNTLGVFPCRVHISVCAKLEADEFRREAMVSWDPYGPHQSSFLNLLEYDLRDPYQRYYPSEHTGIDPIVQHGILASNDFEDLFEHIGHILAAPAPQVLYVFCRHGVHRSPAVASIVHCLLTPHATVVYNRPRTRRAFEALRLRLSHHDSWLANAI